jgi:hypothetical protein
LLLNFIDYEIRESLLLHYLRIKENEIEMKIKIKFAGKFVEKIALWLLI